MHSAGRWRSRSLALGDDDILCGAFIAAHAAHGVADAADRDSGGNALFFEQGFDLGCGSAEVDGGNCGAESVFLQYEVQRR